MKCKALYYLVKFILNTLISFYFLIASWNSCGENCFWLLFPPECRLNKSIDIGLEEFCFVAFKINYCAIFIKTKLTVLWITTRGHRKGFISTMGDNSDEERIEIPRALQYGSIEDIIDIYPMYDVNEDIKLDYPEPEHPRVYSRYCCNNRLCGEHTKGIFIFLGLLAFLLFIVILPFKLLFHKAY